jgi:hypothetical protein
LFILNIYIYIYVYILLNLAWTPFGLSFGAPWMLSHLGFHFTDTEWSM